MSSEVDICNLALSVLGDDATVASISPPEGSPQATHCARFYPVARDAAQTAHEWAFCTRRVELVQNVEAPPYGWAYSYALPDRVLRIVEVVDAAGTRHDFETETSPGGAAVIYTDLQGANARYLRSVADTSRFPPTFTEALAWLLASMLAGTLVKGDKGAEQAKHCLDMYHSVKLPMARWADSTQRRVDGRLQKAALHHAPWMAVR